MKITEAQVYTLKSLRDEFGMSYQKLADWHYKKTGVKLSAKQIYLRIKKIQVS
jgi:hypothetical protein